MNISKLFSLETLKGFLALILTSGIAMFALFFVEEQMGLSWLNQPELIKEFIFFTFILLVLSAGFYRFFRKGVGVLTSAVVSILPGFAILMFLLFSFAFISSVF